jgi:hypothetical protein
MARGCPTLGCGGDPNYAAPGRGHVDGCTHPNHNYERGYIGETAIHWTERVDGPEVRPDLPSDGSSVEERS